MSEEKHTVLMPRCKLDALRIRQRKGLRHRRRGYTYTCTQHHDCHDSSDDDYEGPGGMILETIWLAERYDNEILGLEITANPYSFPSSPASQKSQDSNPLKEEDAAIIDTRKAEWDIKVRKANDYVKRYIHGTLPGPGCRHSNILSSHSSQICRKIEERAQSISNSYETLHEILLHHKSIIQTRWTKKRPRQKQKLLLELWPNMPKMHRPEFHAYRFGGSLNFEENRDSYMWPYINEHDLATRNYLLLLMNSRGLCKPYNFVDSDLAAMKFGLDVGALKSGSLPGYSMVLLDAKNLEDYGTLVDISAYSENEILNLDKNQISPYYSILILKAQDRLLTFLVNCCKQILHDIPEEILVSEAFQILLGAPKILSQSDVYDPTAMAAEAPYRVSAKPNFKQIGSLLGAKVSEARDNLVNLQEDPVHFVNAMMVMKEHSPREGLPASFGGRGLGSYYIPEYDRFALSSDLAFVIGKAYADFECFADLHQQVQELEALHAEYETDVLPFKDVPDEILTALSKYQMCLWEAATTRRLALVKVVRNSPAWYRHFDCGRSLTSFYTDVGSIKSSGVRRHLIWLLQAMTEYDRKFPRLASRANLILPLVMDEIETIRQNEPEAWELTSSLTGEFIDELAILGQCMEQVDMYLRRTRSYKTSILEKEYACLHQFTDRMKHIYFLSKSGPSIYNSFAELANYSTKRLIYPWDKRRTKENVEAMQKAERDLDQFWAAADQHFFYNIEGFRESLLGQQILSLHIRRTPDWIEKPESIIPKNARKSQEEAEIYKPPYTPFADQNESLGKLKQDSRLCVQSKVKTKGQALKVVAQPKVNLVEDILSPSMPSIFVDARALKVFRVLFYNPEVTSSPGEVPWKEFIHAIVCTGFSAQKLQGSMWQFHRVNDDGQQTILFHEPHPHKKLPFYVARSIGWRLNRHFQWSSERFELEKKQAETLE